MADRDFGFDTVKPGTRTAGVVDELIGGRPTIDEFEVVRNPLGALPGWGDLAFEALR